MIAIPFQDSPSFTEEVTIDGVVYLFEFNWNSRGEFWSMSIYDRDQNPLVLGIRMVIFHELIGQFVDRGLPPGELYVIDPSEDMTELEQDDLLSRAYLLYFEEDELEPV